MGKTELAERLLEICNEIDALARAEQDRFLSRHAFFLQQLAMYLKTENRQLQTVLDRLTDLRAYEAAEDLGDMLREYASLRFQAMRAEDDEDETLEKS